MVSLTIQVQRGCGGRGGCLLEGWCSGGSPGAPCPGCLTRVIGTEYPQRHRWGTLGSVSLMPWVGGVLRGERLAGMTPGGVAGPGRSAGRARVCRAPRVSLRVVWGTQTSASPPSPLSRRCQLGGCGILGVGIWLAATQGNFATLSSSFPSLSAANLLIVTGTFVMAIGFVGCIGAIKENKCLLLTFFVLLLLVFLLEATITILFFAYTDKIDRYAQRDLKKGLHLYGTPGNVGLTNAWGIIQTDFRCCGVSNYTDWFEVYNATRVPDSCCLEFSDSCGLHAPGTWWKAPCYETVKMWLQENLLAVGIFGLCTALVQVRWVPRPTPASNLAPQLVSTRVQAPRAHAADGGCSGTSPWGGDL
uniref:Tetraspanin-4 n=1 Tax=Lynx canadensis TaxID=61383 RepID=A0A667IJ11_LYNCA